MIEPELHESDHQAELVPLTSDDLNTSDGQSIDPSQLLTYHEANIFPVGMDNFRGQKRKVNNLSIKFELDPANGSPAARQRWKMAAAKIKLAKDPWHEFHIENYPVETVVRHRYDPVEKSWFKDTCVVKMETKQFANGSMRACFRLLVFVI
jgi:hypothetical protein